MSKLSTRSSPWRAARSAAKIAPPAGPDSTRRTGKRIAGVERHDPAAGMHQEDRAIRALGRQPLAQAAQVGRHQRLDVGVGDCGVEPLVLAHLRRDLAAQRHRHPGHDLGQNLADHALVRVVDVGVQEPDRDALVARGRKLAGQGLDLGAVERDQHVAPGPDPLGQGVAAVARQERGGQDQVEVVLLEPALGPHLDHVPESVRGDERGLRAPPLDQRVGGKRGAVDDLADLMGRAAGARADLA